mmetsp:Transcript_19349/g.32086  ORF Transcript_19349/g.32086 Transcript_19349/m.32086 type:complete len:160 (-) Transcript_19349:66-545(-)
MPAKKARDTNVASLERVGWRRAVNIGKEVTVKDDDCSVLSLVLMPVLSLSGRDGATCTCSVFAIIGSVLIGPAVPSAGLIDIASFGGGCSGPASVGDREEPHRYEGCDCTDSDASEEGNKSASESIAKTKQTPRLRWQQKQLCIITLMCDSEDERRKGQ